MLFRSIVVTSEMDCIPCNRLDYTATELHQHPCVRNITVEQVLEAVDKFGIGEICACYET